MSTLTIPLDPATEAALDEIAAATKRAKVDIVAELVADYAREAPDFAELVREAREDFAAGRTCTAEEVAEAARAIIAGAQARKP